MMQALDIDLLRTFHAVAHLGRFKDAAGHLNKSTSAISVHIQRLEQITGGRLFERNNTGVALSAHGRFLLRETTQLMAEHDRVLSALSSEPVSGRIRLGIPEEYAAGFLDDFLPRFTLGHPGIELIVEAAPSARLVELYGRERLDAVVTVVQRALHDQVRLGTVRPVWAVGADMQALGRSPLPVALHAAGCIYREIMLGSLEEMGRPWRPVVSSGNSAVIVNAIERGLAIGLLAPASLTPKMTVSHVSGLPSMQTFEIVCMHRHEGPAIELLRDALQSYFR